MVSNVAVGFSRTIYASDASLAVGAVVRSEAPGDLSKTLWLSPDRKGYYTRLGGLARSLLAAVGEGPADDVDDDALRAPPLCPLSSLHFSILTLLKFVATQELSHLLMVWSLLQHWVYLTESKHYNFCNLHFLAWIFHMFTSKRFRSTLLAPPCATFFSAAWPDLRPYQIPLHYCRTHTRTLLGNVLAFRSLPSCSSVIVCIHLRASNNLDLLKWPGPHSGVSFCKRAL